eukprot:TRINITY_DN5774_c0_g1_i10.p1 TRINITY_DN5774_c0_g1~~TRINITY_DN5774_c0_g1_i10.p1  ORF type:complete len:269 (+),score=53.75 TRINITY_DN5774_c0_g1_i10:56-808(+)
MEDAAPARSLMLEGVDVKLTAIEGGLRVGCDDVTGFELWQPATLAASEALGELLDKKQKGVALELGCGLGALGIFAARRGAGHVLLTDKELPVLQIAARNAAANGVQCEAVAYDFSRGRSPWRSGVFDLILASDVLFLDRLARPLYGTVEALAGCSSAAPSADCKRGKSSSSATTAIIGHEVRRAVYRGPDGEPCIEPEDSALKAFLEVAGSHARKVEPRSKDSPAVAVVLSFKNEEDESQVMKRRRISE